MPLNDIEIPEERPAGKPAATAAVICRHTDIRVIEQYTHCDQTGYRDFQISGVCRGCGAEVEAV